GALHAGPQRLPRATHRLALRFGARLLRELGHPLRAEIAEEPVERAFALGARVLGLEEVAAAAGVAAQAAPPSVEALLLEVFRSRRSVKRLDSGEVDHGPRLSGPANGRFRQGARFQGLKK